MTFSLASAIYLFFGFFTYCLYDFDKRKTPPTETEAALAVGSLMIAAFLMFLVYWFRPRPVLVIKLPKRSFQ